MKKTLLPLLFCSYSLQLYGSEFSFLFYNDFFIGTDKHFTNGVSLGWIDNSFTLENDSNVTSYTHFIYKFVKKVPYVQDKHLPLYNAGLSLSQYIFTPEDISVNHPQYDDIPYVGYLSLDFFLIQHNSNIFKEYRCSVGVVGETSGAHWLQKKIHTILNSEQPQGWDTQLGPQFTFNLAYKYGNIYWEKGQKDGWRSDLVYVTGIEVGNFITDAFMGVMLRFGYNYRKNFNVHYPYLKEDIANLNIEKIHSHLGYAYSLGINVNGVLYSYIIDASQKQGYDIDTQAVKSIIYNGFELFYKKHKVSFFYQFQTPFIENSLDNEMFGGLSYRYQF